MKKLALLLSCCLFFASFSFAQKMDFYLAPEIGILSSKTEVSKTIGLTAGGSRKQWIYGIGASLDYYKFRSLPLYAEVKRMFGNNLNTPFVYMRAGQNVELVLDRQHQHPQYSNSGVLISDCDFSNGLFYEAGAGMAFKNKKGKGTFLSVGYSRKTLSENWTNRIWNASKNDWENAAVSKKYLLNRVVFKMGIRVF